MGKRKRSGSFSKTDESGAKKSDDGDSQEELDGETLVPHKGNSNNGVRCSARVQEKQEKLRREASPSKQTIVDTTCPGPGPSASGSNKGGKQLVNPEDLCFAAIDGMSTGVVSGVEEKRKKRNWELWSQDDKQLFFEALNEHGKDFDAIQNYIASKLKSRNKTVHCAQFVSKNKDQVRHFYYRTWNKISKYLQFPKDMKKAFQELYGLVNYGELRKKQRVLNTKSAAKLCELVEKGTTTIKVRGKTFRIKTPVCRALKRLNRLDDVEHIRVPCKVSLELIPRNGKAWAAVQSVSHNPRVKVFVPLQRTLASIATFFEDRWKTSSDRLKEQLSLTFGGKPVPRLRFIPIEKRDINLPIFKVSETTSSAKICLRSYTENVLSKERNEELELSTKKLKRKRKQSGCISGPSNISYPFGISSSLQSYMQQQNGIEASDSVAEADGSDVEAQDLPLIKITLPISLPTVNQTLFSIANKSPTEENCVNVINNAIRFADVMGENELLSDNTMAVLTQRHHSAGAVEMNNDNANAATETEDNEDVDNLVEENNLPLNANKVCACGSTKGGDSEDIIAHIWDDEIIRRGWTAEEAGVMTVGELYLMLGQCEKLCFEYYWDTQEGDPDTPIRTVRMVDRLVAAARILKKKKTSRSKASLLTTTPVSHTCTHCGHANEIVTYAGVHTTCSNTTLPSNPTLTVGHNNQQRCHKVNLTDPQQPVSIAVSISSIQMIPVPITAVPTLPGSPYPFVSIIGPIISSNSSITTSAGSKPLRTIYTNHLVSASTVLSPADSGIAKTESIATPQQRNATGLIELSSIATNGIDPADPTKRKSKITATLLPPSSPMLKIGSLKSSSVVNCDRVPSKTISSFSNTVTNSTTKSSRTLVNSKESSSNININKEISEGTFRRPAVILSPLIRSDGNGEIKISPPKPFLDLPKGNRRLGRRPNWKRVVIPRVLPLLPKGDESALQSGNMIAISAIGTSTSTISARGIIIPTTNTIPIPVGQTGIHLATLSSEAIVTMSSNACGSIPSASTSVISDRESCHFEISRSLTGVASISDDVNRILGTPSNFDDLLKLRQEEAKHTTADMESNLSLSSFMEISLPESTRLVANECLNSDKFLDNDLDDSNCSLSLGNFLKDCDNDSEVDAGIPKYQQMDRHLSEYINAEELKIARQTASLDTPKKQPPPTECFQSTSPPSTPLVSLSDNQWLTSDPGDLSLSSLLGALDPLRSNTASALSESDFQSMMGDGSVDYVSKFSELSSQMASNNKK